ncbi:hypothetical protein RhiirA5_506413 [Rhizophagus irregularis]|uniref:Uncharacterized protein n=1 Tax=Rhizophagus irregularis TaxID=588596 RepID=A0A2N0NTN7_9GLOM|nr:hypothetical protein RhiirA5_506413 [Rhizophagus irregularis]
MQGVIQRLKFMTKMEYLTLIETKVMLRDYKIQLYAKHLVFKRIKYLLMINYPSHQKKENYHLLIVEHLLDQRKIMKELKIFYQTMKKKHFLKRFIKKISS